MVLGDFSSDYGTRLISLNYCHLYTYIYELSDILFPINNFNVQNLFFLAVTCNLLFSTTFSISSQLKHISLLSNFTHHTYSYKTVHLWNIYPATDLKSPLALSSGFFIKYFDLISLYALILPFPALFISLVPVIAANLEMPHEWK